MVACGGACPLSPPLKGSWAGQCFLRGGDGALRLCCSGHLHVTPHRLHERVASGVRPCMLDAGLDQAGERGRAGPGRNHVPDWIGARAAARCAEHPEADGHRCLAAWPQPHTTSTLGGGASACMLPSSACMLSLTPSLRASAHALVLRPCHVGAPVNCSIQQTRRVAIGVACIFGMEDCRPEAVLERQDKCTAWHACMLPLLYGVGCRAAVVGPVLRLCLRPRAERARAAQTWGLLGADTP